jgi:hypothetical protein
MKKSELKILIKEQIKSILTEEYTAKPTMATLKNFIKKNKNNLFVNVLSEFDGMVDGVETRTAGFLPAKPTTYVVDHTLGIDGIYCVGRSRDYIKTYDDAKFNGYSVSNSVGHFVVAIKK